MGTAKGPRRTVASLERCVLETRRKVRVVDISRGSNKPELVLADTEVCTRVQEQLSAARTRGIRG